MPPLVLIAAIGAGCYAGYRLASKLLATASAEKPEVQRARTSRAPTRDLGDLEWDSKTGAYRPKER